MIKVFVLVTACVWLSGCAVYTPAGSVVIDPVDSSDYSHGVYHEYYGRDRHHGHDDGDDD